MRAVIYARYSTDRQNDASIEDQIEVCRRYAEQQGWIVVLRYEDRATSGASAFRPGYQALLADLNRRAFDIVLAQGLDRLSRKLADIATLFDHLSFAGVKLVTVSHGEITPVHVALLGAMAQMYLSDLRENVRRGQLGRVRRGKLPGGGKAYGYDTVDPQDAVAGGESVGVRRINDAEAAVVRRVFELYANGVSPRAIARRLNEEGVPGPGGRPWSDSTIRGQVDRGTGLLNNPLYAGAGSSGTVAPT